MNLGATNIATMKLGSQQVSRVMLGSVEVWSAVSMDTDAAAYIAAVETALGSSITSTQASAINAFIVAEKAASRWSTIKRFYLPIWANESANAIDMVTLGSGSFAGTVTHAAGYVQGDGSSGCFNFGNNPLSIGLSLAGGSCAFAVVAQKDSRSDAREIIGVTGLSNRRVRITHSTATGTACTLHIAGSGSSTRAYAASGVLIAYRKDFQLNLTRLTNALGYQDAGETTVTSTSEPTPDNNQFAMAYNAGATQSLHTNSRMGCYGLATLGTQLDAEELSAALKTLWETCTGLTLP
jgi:hypothetical protein